MAALTTAQREAEADRRLDEAFRKRARVLMAAADIGTEKLAEMMGMSRPTLWSRLKEPGTFRLTELRRFRRLEKRFLDDEKKGGVTEWPTSA